MIQNSIVRGRCLLCHERFRKSPMIRHMAACPRWETGPRRLVILLFEGTPAGSYWFFVAVDVVASLRDLDRFLRGPDLRPCRIESTGSFRTPFKRRIFQDRPGEPDSTVESLDIQLDTLIEPDLRLWYDAGKAESPLAMRVLVERKGVSPRDKVLLLARNE